MALAEARAAWQRTANRCLVQEDAKRAPRLACYSSVPPSAQQNETGYTNEAGVQDIPSSNSLPSNRSPSYSNLSPNSRWWLQLQPNYGYQKGLMDEECVSIEGNTETCQVQEHSGGVPRNEDGSRLVDQTSHVESHIDNQCRNFMTCGEQYFKDEKLISVCNWNYEDALKLAFREDVKELRDEGPFSFEFSKISNDLYFDSESSCVGAEKNTPWWRNADTDELASLVSQRSVDVLENCDLPMPQNTYIKKNLSGQGRCSSHEEMSTSLLVRKTGTGSHHHSYPHNSTPASPAGRPHQKLRVVAENQLQSGPDRLLRNSPTHKRKPETHASDDDASKGQLLEALLHSQTRAREAEKVAKQACAEKEHIVRLVFRQASQLFAYKQWLQLLQLENMYFQFKNNKSLSAFTFSPETLPWRTPRTSKKQKGWPKSPSRKEAKRARPWYNVGKYAIVFALGLGIVGAGLLLGWTIGWMQPAW